MVYYLIVDLKKCVEVVMTKDLTNSQIDRQNILNNSYAIGEIEKACNIEGILFEDKITFTKEQVAQFYEIDIRTLERYLEVYSDEFKANGYDILKGKRLKAFIKIYNTKVTDMNVGDLANSIPSLAIFDFRAFLNIGMLLVESEKAKVIRKNILDIVIDTINIKTGGATKYINQRDEDFLNSWFDEENYRREFTDALNNYIAMGNIKYAIYTDKIYESIFREKATEYRSILKLEKKDKTRDTFYSEVLDLIASYETGLAEVIAKKYFELGRKLTSYEADEVFNDFEKQSLYKPLINKVRIKMASRDFAFRDALHEKVQNYITPLEANEYERFLGEKSEDLKDRLEEAKD